MIIECERGKYIYREREKVRQREREYDEREWDGDRRGHGMAGWGRVFTLGRLGPATR